jgi:phosphoribosylamine--glycine ligase
MKLLLVGHGGREHTLLHVLARDMPDSIRYITRGNGGTQSLAQAIPFSPDDAASLAAWADAQRIDLTVVGPEAPLAAGIQAHFAQRGLAIFAPSAAAARIESSKAYAKQLMQRAGVPTAAFRTFSDIGSAESFIREHGAPIVVKASGLAAGKGAVVCQSVQEALDAARAMLRDHVFGDAGSEIVIEEFLTGEELSIFALTDGQNALLMPAAQDHKRVGERDTGPNTGGMGAYAPTSIAPQELSTRVERDVFLPVLDALRADGSEFRGLLYAGLMLTERGPKVIEFNARFGDPETQALLPLLTSSLLGPMREIARGGMIANHKLEWSNGAALTTVLAAAGYPGTVEKGTPIHIPASVESRSDVLVFHAGTERIDGRLVTAGGRVLAVTGLGASLEDAAAASRAAAALIDFDGKHYRRDIGWRELERRTAVASRR